MMKSRILVAVSANISYDDGTSKRVKDVYHALDVIGEVVLLCPEGRALRHTQDNIETVKGVMILRSITFLPHMLKGSYAVIYCIADPHRRHGGVRRKCRQRQHRFHGC